MLYTVDTVDNSRRVVVAFSLTGKTVDILRNCKTFSNFFRCLFSTTSAEVFLNYFMFFPSMSAEVFLNSLMFIPQHVN